MSSRPLSDYEIQDLLGRYAQLANLVAQHEQLFGGPDPLAKWDQVVIAAQGDTDTYGQPVPIPPRGVSFDDASYGHVIVYPDAAGVLHYIATDNASLATEIQKPVYASDPDYWQLFQDIAKKYQEAASGLGLHVETGVIAAAVLVVGLLLFAKR